MRNFLIVLKFELENYFKNKTYLITTFGIAIVLAIGICIPTIFNFNDKDKSSKEEVVTRDEKMMLCDPNHVFDDLTLLEAAFPSVNFETVSDISSIEKAVENKEIKAGFAVESTTQYTYYVYDKEMGDYNTETFSEVLKQINMMQYATSKGIDYQELTVSINPIIESNEQILGKDNMGQFWYCYTLVIIVFVLLTFYGQMIATSITVEKSNRSIEVLVTSTTPYSLLFGKVFAGAIAGVIQMGIILIAALGSYQLNRETWGGSLDMLLKIPNNVLLTFAIFGIGGYLFYAFLYGMLGALVSKTEDINKSSTGLQMILMIAYFVALFQLSNPNGMIMKIASFLPFTSFISMFVRVAMGSAQIYEVIISVAILFISVILAGMLGAKIYRQQTLRYGNPIKFKDALKSLKDK